MTKPTQRSIIWVIAAILVCLIAAATAWNFQQQQPSEVATGDDELSQPGTGTLQSALDESVSGPRKPTPEELAEMEQADKELQELIDQGWIPIAGPNGLAGYSRVEDIRADFGADVFAPPPLADRDAPVYATTDGEVLVGYLTAAVGFVDLQTYDSPEFDADELREQAQYNPTPDELEALRFWIETLQHAAINE